MSSRSTIRQFDDLGSIIAFVQAAHRQSFTAAGETLGVSKSAVGKSVTRLETRLGTKLLHRTTRKLTLTADGEAYFAACRSALDEIETAEASLAARTDKLAGRLRIDAPAAWGRQFLLPIVAKIVKQHQELTISLSLTDRIIDPVEERVDLVIRFGETTDTNGLISRKLTEQTAMIVASPSYIAARGEPATIDDIRDHDCIVGFRRDIPATWRVTESDGTQIRISPPATHEIGDGAAIVDAAVLGLGLAQMPSSLVDEHIRAGTLQPILPAVSNVRVGIYAVWPTTRHLLPRVQQVVRILVEEARAGALGG